MLQSLYPTACFEDIVVSAGVILTGYTSHLKKQRLDAQRQPQGNKQPRLKYRLTYLSKGGSCAGCVWAIVATCSAATLRMSRLLPAAKTSVYRLVEGGNISIIK